MSPYNTAAGFRVTFERLRRGSITHEVMGAKTSQPSIARQQASKKSGFIRVINLEPLTAEQYAQQFPEGQTGRDGHFISYRA